MLSILLLLLMLTPRLTYTHTQVRSYLYAIGDTLERREVLETVKRYHIGTIGWYEYTYQPAR